MKRKNSSLFLMLCLTVGYVYPLKWVSSNLIAHARAALPHESGKLCTALFNHTEGMIKDHLKKILLGLIHAEQEKIWCILYRLTDQQIVDALTEAAERGVSIGLIVDAGCIHDMYGKLDPLKEWADEIYIYSAYRSILHDKIFMFGNNSVLTGGNRQIVWTGSANATNAGMSDNVENVLILNKKLIFQQYRDEYEKIKKSSITLSRYRIQMMTFDGASDSPAEQ